MRNTADVTGGKPIAVLLQSISGVRAINSLVAFYDIHGGKREVLFFYFVPDTTRDSIYIYLNMQSNKCIFLSFYLSFLSTVQALLSLTPDRLFKISEYNLFIPFIIIL
jgi:hypothetical protein